MQEKFLKSSKNFDKGFSAFYQGKQKCALTGAEICLPSPAGDGCRPAGETVLAGKREGGDLVSGILTMTGYQNGKNN